MNGLTLFAVRDEDGAGSDALATDDGRFSVRARLFDVDDGYLHLRVRLGSPDEQESFGFFHVVVDLEGALLQMAVGETDEMVAERVHQRMLENEIDLDGKFEDLAAGPRVERAVSVLCANGAGVTLRAKAYPSDAPPGESLLCLRIVCEPFGAAQIVISDCGRLLAIATGRRDREAYQRVRHELNRRGFELDPSDGPRAGSRSSI